MTNPFPIVSVRLYCLVNYHTIELMIFKPLPLTEVLILWAAIWAVLKAWGFLEAGKI